MKNMIIRILFIIIIVACIPILFVDTNHLYGLIATLNYYLLSPFSLPVLILMPLIFKNKKLFWGYILLFPLGWNIFFILYFLDGTPYSYVSLSSFIVGILISIYLKKFFSKNI